MQGLKTPEQFSFKPEEWPAWIQEFKRYRNAAKLSKEEGEIQRDTLLYVMGRESEKIFQTFNFVEITVGQGEDARQIQENDTDFDTVVRKFDAYFIVKRNIIHERTKFQERKQAESETIEEFYRSLRALVAHCDYADLEDQVRDRFVVGLIDRRLKEKLQLTHELTLSKAIEIARQHEQVKLQLKEQQIEERAETAETQSKFRNKGQTQPSPNKWANSGPREFRQLSSSSRGRRNFRGPVLNSGKQCGRCGLQSPWPKATRMELISNQYC